jgi:Microtubule binding
MQEEQALAAQQKEAELTARLAEAQATIESQEQRIAHLQAALAESSTLNENAEQVRRAAEAPTRAGVISGGSCGADRSGRAVQAVTEAAALRAELRRESLLRKRAHNELRELKGNIRVLCRVRPAAAGAVNAHLGDSASGRGLESSAIALREQDEYTISLDTVSMCAPFPHMYTPRPCEVAVARL